MDSLPCHGDTRVFGEVGPVGQSNLYMAKTESHATSKRDKVEDSS